MASDPLNSVFQKMHSTAGEPDLYFARRYKDGGHKEFRAEAKYVDRLPNTLKAVFELMQKNQQVVIPRMANASKIPIYLIVCEGGKTAYWYLFEPNQCKKSVRGLIPAWEVLALVYESRRERTGKWKIANPGDKR